MGCAPSHPQLMGGTDAFDAKDIVLVVNKKAYNVSQFTQIMGAAAKISVKDSSFQSGGTLDKESVAFALRLMECDSAKGDEGGNSSESDGVIRVSEKKAEALQEGGGLTDAQAKEVRNMPPMCVSDAVVDEARVKLIRASWDRITNGQTSVLEEDKEENPLSSSATYFYTYFYDRLFAIDPSSKALFGNMQSQGKALFKMISTAVSVLEDTETLVGALKGLARRHTTYGVTSVHYTFVGLALVQTLVHTLAENWNDELGAAWVHCYSLMMTVMIPIQTEFDEKKANGEAETKGAEE